MVVFSFYAASSMGKRVMVGVFLLVEVFLLGVAGAPSQSNGKELPLGYNWDPANPPLWSIRPEDREFFTVGKSYSLQNRGTDAKVASATPFNYTWDPQDPPPWTIRPEHRNNLLGNTMSSQEAKAAKGNNEPVPCENKDRPAKLYEVYGVDECPPNYRFLPLEKGMGFADTCEEWNTYFYFLTQCTTFCQTTTRFEWAQEVPYPHSECHFPIQCGLSESDSTTTGWSGGLSTKVQPMKALKIGITGGWSYSYGDAEGKKFDVQLTEGQCGYFTFVPVKKVVCGGLTEPAETPRWYDLSVCKSYPKNSRQCDNQLWKIKGQRLNKADYEIPDGTIIFVYTDCLTRMPLPMSKQDPVYQAPGVALHHEALHRIKEGWVWNTCYMWNMGVKDKLSLYIHGSGFSDSMIGPEGKKLTERVNHCVRAAEGVISDVEFTWYHSGTPGEDPKKTGAMWIFMADVPSNIRPGCLGDAMMELGGSTKDQCVGDKFGG
ncbi:hypothetical protein LZ30DRAFT_683583 [Colletotrichum cereale]|nr:hypothetical protein LZ30DRAFT_683583 [Colletotrichum cereale]